MKKFFAAALVVSMLTVLLSGCMCQVADTTFQFDGSGTVEAKFGFSEEMVNAMNMRAEMPQNGFSYFRYNGHSYDSQFCPPSRFLTTLPEELFEVWNM